jgi:hypothetical protein
MTKVWAGSQLFEMVPDSTWNMNGNFKAVQLNETAIPNKYKELIGVAISGSALPILFIISYGNGKTGMARLMKRLRRQFTLQKARPDGALYQRNADRL